MAERTSRTVGYLHAFIEREGRSQYLVICDEATKTELMTFKQACTDSDHCPGRCRVYAVSEVKR